MILHVVQSVSVCKPACVTHRVLPRCVTGSFNPKGSLAQGVEVQLDDDQSSTSSKPPLNNIKHKSKSSGELMTSDTRLTESSASAGSLVRGSGSVENSKTGTPSHSMVSSSRSLESRDGGRSGDHVNGSNTATRASVSLTSQQQHKAPAVDAKTSKSMIASQSDDPLNDNKSRSRDVKTSAASGPKFYYNVVELLEKGKTMT